MMFRRRVSGQNHGFMVRAAAGRGKPAAMNPVKSYVKSRTTWAFRSAVRQIEKEWQLSLRHRRSLKKVPRLLQVAPLRLNLGCGTNVKQGWVNVDLFNPQADLQLDLRELWPFADNSVCHIYSEHVFEHFD